MPSQSAASMSAFITVNGKVIRSQTSGFIPQLLVLTQNSILPTNTVMQFDTAAAVSSYFGATTNASETGTSHYADAKNATAYFSASANKGFGNPPSSILFYRYCETNTLAFTRGSALSISSNLATLKLVTAGTLKLLFNGITYNVTGIDLSGANSFTAMATIIQTATVAVSGLTGTTVKFDTTTNAFTITTQFATVDYIINSGTGVADQLAQRMLITQSLGAILSQYVAAQTPAQVMDAVTNLTNNFATFICNFDINTDSTYAVVLGLTAWTNAQQYFYLPIFYDYLGGATSPITAPMKTALINDGYGQNSVLPWTLSVNVMEMIINIGSITLPFAVAGVIASNNFNTINGVIQLNATTFTGILPTITNNNDLNLLLNTFGSNSYINLNTRANNFQWFETGSIGGNYGWADTYVGYMWLADQCQTQIAFLMQNLNSIPYDNLSIINSVLEPIFEDGLKNGFVQKNIPLTAVQIQQLIAQVGYDFSSILYITGYYIPQIVPSATDIANRELGNVNAWYTYAGGPVYITVNLTTVE